MADGELAIVFHGWLMKRKTKRGLGIGSKWNRRYFTVEAILPDSQDEMVSTKSEYAVCYYHSEHDALTLDLPSREPGGWFYLSSITEIKLQPNQPSSVTKSKYPHAFLIRTRKRDLHVRAPNERELHMWMAGIAATCGVDPPKHIEWPRRTMG